MTTKNGSAFAAVVPRSSAQPGVWDPHFYAHDDASHPPVGDFVHVSRPRRAPAGTPIAGLAPIEYRHVLAGDALSFMAEPASASLVHGVAAPGTILFGTMRAYLGNIVVVPKPEWLGLAPGTMFAVKSEFLVVEPKDGLPHYWAQRFRSKSFLGLLPLGGGGTRPRLHADAFLRIPVDAAPARTRERIDAQLARLAEQEWQLALARREAIARIE